MSLAKMYEEKYGKPGEKTAAAADPKLQAQKQAAALGGKMASASFFDELGKLVEADKKALSK